MKTRFSKVAAALLLSLTATTAFIAVPQAALAQATPPAATAPAATTATPAATDIAATPATSMNATPEKEKVDNPYGLDALWKGGDFVARFTLIALVIMSMASWYIMVTKLVDHMRMSGQAKAARSVSSPKTPYVRPSIMKARCWNRSTSIPGSRCRFSVRSKKSRAACRMAWRCWRQSARLPRSSACSVRSGVFTTH